MAQVPLKLPDPPQGVIASLVTGFETVNARLELVLLPLALDLFLWLGPHLSIQPLVQSTVSDLAQLVGSDAAVLQGMQSLLVEYGATFNLFSAFSTSPLGLPSLAAGRSPVSTPLGQPVIWQIDNLLVYVLLFGIFTLLGLFLGAVYFGGIAQQVRDRRLDWALLLRQVWGDWARLTALAALALGLIVFVGTPVLLVALVAGAFSPLAGTLVWLAGFTLMMWLLFYAGFAVHAMLLQRRSLFGALWDSARLVQFNLPQAASLFLVVVLIYAGLALVWNLPQDDSWFMALGLAGHSLIATALVTATFVFYQDRFRWWTEMRRTLQARAESERRGLRRKA